MRSRWFWLIGFVVAASSVSLSCVCTQRGCESSAELELPIHAGRVDDATFRVCRNADCNEGPLNALIGPLHVENRTSLGSDALRLAVIDDAVGAPDFRDGDVYSVEAWDAFGESVTASWTARYQEIYPNGEGCDDSPCRVAQLTPTTMSIAPRVSRR